MPAPKKPVFSPPPPPRRLIRRRQRLLVACEFSGKMREAFRAKGWDAWSCDLLPTEQPGQHFQGDVREMLAQPWDMIIAHPECTYITNSGVRWLDRDIERWKQMWEACEFFRLFLEHPCPKVVIENPIPHKYALRWIGQRHSQVIQPWQFGEPFTKATCLWLKGLPLLQPTRIITIRQPAVWLEPPGPERQKNRSRSYDGICQAMADQWGSLPE